MRFVGFIGPSYKLSSVNVDCQRCINLYPELNELGTGKDKEVAALVATPGLRLLVNLPGGVVRGIYTTSKGTVYAVGGTKLYSISSAFVATQIGVLATSSGQVSMADNGLQLFIVDGTNGYYVTLLTNVLTQVVDDAFPGADQVTYQDGYFIFNHPNSGQFFISGLNDITFDVLDFASSEGNPDNIVGLISDHRDLWIFNKQTIEIFYDSGNGDFPFERVQGAFIEHGCAARFSIAKMNNTVFWLGQDDKGNGMIFQAKGYQPQRISTHAVEQAIQTYGDISDAVAYTYQQNGHHFYVINFPSADTTWAFDTTTSMWHERVYTNQGDFERHRANCHAFAFSTHIVGDYENGNLYALESATYTDNGNAITRQRVAPHQSQDMVRLFFSSFQLDFESGTGLDGLGQGTDPQAVLQFSDDGGHSWSNEKWAALGKIGETKRRAIWRRLGSARDRVMKVTITDPVKVVIIGAEIQATSGAA